MRSARTSVRTSSSTRWNRSRHVCNHLQDKRNHFEFLREPNRRRLVKLAVLLALGLLASSADAASGDIYNLGTLPGGTSSHGYAINASGQVTGQSDTTGSFGHPFLYTGTPGSGGSMVDLGDSLDYSAGRALNASGQVTGWVGSQGASAAWLYTGTPGSGGGMAFLGTLGSGGKSAGNGINASGQVAGGATTAGGASHAFLYTGIPGSGGAMADLGTLGGSSSGGTAINTSGQVTGSSDTAGGASHAFLYTGTPGSGGAMADLGTLPGWTNSIGTAINDSGQVAGWIHNSDSVNAHAFLYTGTPGSGGSMADLSTLGGSGSIGEAINAFGQVAGYSYTTGNLTTHAFLYTGTPGIDGHMIDLNSWLDTHNPIDGAKWTLREASGLNDTGLITGTGVYHDGLGDSYRAFVLDASALVPEPAGLALLGIGAVALLSRWKRRTFRLGTAPGLRRPVRQTRTSPSIFGDEIIAAPARPPASSQCDARISLVAQDVIL